MMESPLLVGSMLEYSEIFYPNKTIISQTHDKLHTFTYKELGGRVRRLMGALKTLGITPQDRVATIAWNHHRHLELYFAAPGMGAIVHTINFRLTPQMIAEIILHAEDKVIFIDEDLLPLLEAIASHLVPVKAFIVMTDKEKVESSLTNLLYYEDLIAKGDSTTPFITDLDEKLPAGMCYTSATTGKPKGVFYSHRGLTLHSYALGHVDFTAISERDVCMPIVPQFHVNAWGMPYACTWFGSTQIYPGPRFTAKSLAKLMHDYQVTMTAGVPTILLGLATELINEGYDTSHVRGILCGGSAASPRLIQMFEEDLNIPFLHAYGLTETTPLVAFSRLKSYQTHLTKEEKLKHRERQGQLAPGLKMKVLNSQNNPVTWNGEEMGELLLRGPWIADSYYNDPRTKETFIEGWFHTGDIATVDNEGVIKIVDRKKDLIKSGGEWISSVDLENRLMGHPAVKEACVIAVPSLKWQERPVACVVLQEGALKDKVLKDERGESEKLKTELLDFMRPYFPSYWLPDEVFFINEIPKTSVGKFLKRALRETIVPQYLKRATKE